MSSEPLPYVDPATIAVVHRAVEVRPFAGFNDHALVREFQAALFHMEQLKARCQAIQDEYVRRYPQLVVLQLVPPRG